MNDPAHIEAAQGLAKRMKAHSDSLADQLSHGMLLATQAVAEPAVIQELESLYRDAAADYKAKPNEAKHLLYFLKYYRPLLRCGKNYLYASVLLPLLLLLKRSIQE